MSDSKHSDFVEQITHGVSRQLTTVTLSPEQFESLYLQPRRTVQPGGLASRVGNPTPLGVSSFLLAHMPLAMDLLNFQGATAASSTGMLGAFYGCAGIGLYLASIMEWLIGNTFPCVVFGTFGGFWISYGVSIQPTFDLAASFAPASDANNGITAAAAGAMTREYNTGLGLYFCVWGIMCVLYFIAALRTNVPFAIIFLSKNANTRTLRLIISDITCSIGLVFAFEFIGAGYFHTGQGHCRPCCAGVQDCWRLRVRDRTGGTIHRYIPDFCSC
ncbi:GPR1/FUN34/yaaH family-domain-containing protein [Phellopilus nigrolimitatus]|nr:GPR1/FUN34/yaaH family-domain-containing protein [Phellopilus nigrolimitatus]